MTMYVKITAITLALLLLFNTLYVALTYAYYNIDQLDFIEQFCVNKDKPEMKCNGKCHLKKVAQENSDNNTTPTTKITFKEITLFVEKEFSYTLFSFSEEQKNLFYYQENYSYLNTYTLFHPPQGMV